MKELTELEKVLIRKIDRFEKEFAIMKDIILNGLPNEEKQPVKPKQEKYNPSDDLKFFNDDDFQLVWKEYMSIRIRKKASNTDRAIKGVVNALIQHSKGNKGLAIAIVDRSVNSGWTGLFEHNDYKVPISEKKPTNTDRYNREKQRELNPEEYTDFNPSDLMGLVKKSRK